MALVLGTNCGFVTEAPTSDPGEATDTADDRAYSLKHTAPPGAIKVIEIGWYCDNATQAANTQVGIYSHNVGDDEPEALLGTSGDFAKGTTAGWKVKTGLNIEITAGTIYWIALQLDNTATTTYVPYLSWLPPARIARKNAQTSLPSPWGASDWTRTNGVIAIYAVYEIAAPAPGNSQMMGANF